MSEPEIDGPPTQQKTTGEQKFISLKLFFIGLFIMIIANGLQWILYPEFMSQIVSLTLQQTSFYQGVAIVPKDNLLPSLLLIETCGIIIALSGPVLELVGIIPREGHP